jgi:hypothetical protein
LSKLMIKFGREGRITDLSLLNYEKIHI